jgi:hypothetical protein
MGRRSAGEKEESENSEFLKYLHCHEKNSLVSTAAISNRGRLHEKKVAPGNTGSFDGSNGRKTTETTPPQRTSAPLPDCQSNLLR